MKEPEWQLDVAPTAAEVYEAMVLAGKSKMHGGRRIIAFLHGVFMVFLAPIAVTMLLWIGVQLAGGPAMGELPVAVVPLTLLGAGALGMWLIRKTHYSVAELTVASRFGRAQQVRLDAGGIALRTGQSQWHSGWGDVEAVLGGKTCICIAISGIALPLPLHAFANPPDVTHALQTMQTWQREAA